MLRSASLWTCIACATAAAIASPRAARAEAPATGRLEPGAIASLPGKGRLPRREGLGLLTVGGGVLVGERGTGAEAFVAFRFAETVGIGGGIDAGSSGAAAFVRLDALGLAVNHWLVLAHADYVVDASWRFGGALVAPVRRDTYVRFSVLSDLDADARFGVGLEHDLW